MEKFNYQNQEVYFMPFNDGGESSIKVIPIEWYEKNDIEQYVECYDGSIDMEQFSEELREEFEDFPTLKARVFYIP